MSVLLANRRLRIRRRAVATRDAHGDNSVAPWGPWTAATPGRAVEGPDVAVMNATGGRTWVLALDPGLWPVHQGDLAGDADSGEEWLITTADLLTNNAAPDIDYIRVEAHGRAAAATRP